jgi:GT2 family glycosyltransferase
MKVVASIVAFQNDQQTLQKSMESFLNSAGDTSLYLLDNSPKDNLKSLVTDPRIQYTHVGKNIGFGPGHNRAMRESLNKADYHLVLDPDVYFEKNVIPHLVGFMDQNPEVGLVMPKVLYPDGRLQRLCKLLPSPYTLIVRRFLSFIPVIQTKVNKEYELHSADYNQVMDVPFLSGCFMFFRTRALGEVGLFDERFFLYCEDIDLSRRMHRRFRTVYLPSVFIYHFFGKAPYKNLRALLVNIQSAVTYFNKWGWFYDPERKQINKATLARWNNKEVIPDRG